MKKKYFLREGKWYDELGTVVANEEHREQISWILDQDGKKYLLSILAEIRGSEHERFIELFRTKRNKIAQDEFIETFENLAKDLGLHHDVRRVCRNFEPVDFIDLESFTPKKTKIREKMEQNFKENINRLIFLENTKSDIDEDIKIIY